MEAALKHLAASLGVKTEEFVEVPDLRVTTLDTFLLECPETPQTMKEELRKRLESQKGYKVVVPYQGEYRLVIGPRREGYECWLFSQTGYRTRI